MSENDVTAIQSMASPATPMALRVAVTLGLPDRLRGDGATPAALAAELGVDATALRLLLNHLTSLGFAECAPTGYRTTVSGHALCRDAAGALANLLDLNSAGGHAELAFTELLPTVTTGEPTGPWHAAAKPCTPTAGS
ncbi:methyltransferase family protein [Nocardia jiangsuensis]|uniref:O-methyltransferase dimerisation domain-containing protein n=1 Tax=Nocardia jiangsuensis TaxID=1691563 RepID=A0ABV8E1J2_9NOCA